MKQDTSNLILAISAILTVLITALTAGFIGAQAYLMREQAEIMRTSSLEANLQSRIMNLCADFAFYADEARSRVTLWGSVKRREPAVSHAELDERRLYIEAVNTLIDFRPRIDQLMLFSQGTSRDKLRSLKSRVTEFLPYLLENTRDARHEGNILEWWDERVNFIKERCHSVLIGELKSLI